MTSEPEAAPAAAAQNARYQNFAELRQAHLDLRDSLSNAPRGSDPAATNRIRALLAKAQQTGAILTEPGVRKAAQSVLDYWCAELAGLPDAKAQDFVPLTLAAPDPSALPGAEQAAGAADQSAQRKEDQRILIRLSGTARQWRNSGKQAGYLLTGEALQQARPFANEDVDLLEFFQASEHAERAKRRRKRNVVYGLLLVAVALGSIATVLFWQFYTLPETTKSWIRQIKATTSSEVQASNLKWLAFFQPWTAPYDLSGTPRFTNIRFPDLQLNAPNFSSVEFSKIIWPRAQMPSASFSASYIHIDAENGDPEWNSVKWNDFTGAELRLSQFREAQIIATSFAGADLYRAVFDRALLCDVNFTHADLLNASFWGAAMDDRTYGWLRKTAWWVAVGWSSENFDKLSSRPGEDPSNPQSGSVHQATSTADARLLRQALSTSDRFRKDVVALVAETRAGTFDRAFALNDMAWTLTTWGIDAENLKEDPAPCDANPEPRDALNAAGQAICIIVALKDKGSDDRDYDYWLATFRDTQAYILMQGNRMSEAQALYEQDIGRTEADGGMLFRYAVALYANRKETEANPRFKTAIREKHYLPTTELENLKTHIPLNVRQMALEAFDLAYPAPKPAQTCPAAAN